MDCERNLGKFGTHAEKSRAPHPENCAGTAEGNAPATPAMLPVPTVLQARYRLRGTLMEPSFACVLSKIYRSCFHGSAEFAHLNETGTDRKQKSYADDADHCGDAPDKSVDRLIDFDDTSNIKPSFLPIDPEWAGSFT